MRLEAAHPGVHGTERSGLAVEATCWLLVVAVLVQQPLLQIDIAGSILLIRSWDIAWLLFVVAATPRLITLMRRGGVGSLPRPVWAFALYAGFVVLSLTWVAATFRTEGLVASVIRAGRFALIAYAAAMLPLCLNRARFNRLTLVVAFAGLVGGIEALYALYHDTTRAQGATGPVQLGVTRPGGPFGNYFADGTADHWWVQSSASTNLGFWLGVSGAVFMVVAATNWQRGRRLFFVGACLASTVAFFALAATGSREAWVGGFLIVALVVALVGRRQSYRTWFIPLLAISTVVAVVLVSIPTVRARFADTLTPGTFSFRTGPEARIHAWGAGLRIGAERFPIGWGIGGVEEHADRFGRATAENILIQVWMQTSIVGVILFIGWFVASVIAAASAFRAHGYQTLTVLPGAVLLLLLAHGMFGYAIGDPTIQVLLALALASLSILFPVARSREP